MIRLLAQSVALITASLLLVLQHALLAYQATYSTRSAHLFYQDAQFKVLMENAQLASLDGSSHLEPAHNVLVDAQLALLPLTPDAVLA